MRCLYHCLADHLLYVLVRWTVLDIVRQRVVAKQQMVGTLLHRHLKEKECVTLDTCWLIAVALPRGAMDFVDIHKGGSLSLSLYIYIIMKLLILAGERMG